MDPSGGFELRSARLLLRPIALADIPAFFEYRSDPEIGRFQSFRPERLEDARAFLAATAREPDLPGTWFQLGIFSEGAMIGDIGIHFLGSDDPQCEIGYTLSRDSQGKGYASEAVSAVLEYLFSVLGKHRVTASVDPENRASIRLLERAGFRKEGLFVKSLLVGGEWKDDMAYGLLAEERR
jgi:RimJ/RimL family protein N-acetyltransferase